MWSRGADHSVWGRKLHSDVMYRYSEYQYAVGENSGSKPVGILNYIESLKLVHRE